MINVTDQYNDAVYSTIRTAAGKVIFQIIDVSAKDDASGTVTGEAVISHKDQMFNSNINMSGKLATFENNYWVLDGSFVLPPKPSESGYETGWWSEALSGSDGNFAAAQEIEIQFTEDHSSIGLTIIFDQLTNEYAENFTIYIYNSTDTLIHTEIVTGNEDTKYILEQNISDYRKILISITKWANAYRRARITEISFGIVEEYTGNKLINAKVLEEIDTLNDLVSSNEFKFTIDNQDKAFNILNPDGVYAYLQRLQKIEPYIGIKRVDETVEYIPMGVYYLNEWKSDEGALTATFTARDILDILSQNTYRKGLYQTRSLYDLAEDILTDAGISDYEIDTALQSISATGNIPIMSHREALQTIAIVGMAVVCSARYGKIIIKQLSDTPLDEQIDFDNVYAAPLVKLDKLINIVNVSVNAYNAEASASEIHKSTMDINGTVDVWIEYSGLSQGVSANVTGGTLNSADYYGNAALLNITASGTVTITANGTLLKKSSQVYQLIDDTAPSGEQPLTIKLDNPLISTNTIAANVAAWILAEYKKRYLYEITWRMNPALETGDILTVEDEFSEDKTMRITKQEFNFAGYLNGKTYGKGGGT